MSTTIFYDFREHKKGKGCLISNISYILKTQYKFDGTIKDIEDRIIYGIVEEAMGDIPASSTKFYKENKSKSYENLKIELRKNGIKDKKSITATASMVKFSQNECFINKYLLIILSNVLQGRIWILNKGNWEKYRHESVDKNRPIFYVKRLSNTQFIPVILEKVPFKPEKFFIQQSASSVSFKKGSKSDKFMTKKRTRKTRKS